MTQPDPTEENLHKIDHIVVLMLENRSFDHMLGYLTLKGRNGVDGLQPAMSNFYKGKEFRIHRLESGHFEDDQDPCHSGACVIAQLLENNGGFVANYAAKHPHDPEPEKVMGHYDGDKLFVYDYLADAYCICDRWFASVPGSTWPNRLYALTGRADGSKDNRTIPIYNIPSFVRHLDSNDVSWRWYTQTNLLGRLTTLKLTDKKYRHSENYRWYRDFISDAANGLLPAVSWIDPAFTDSPGVSSPTDDHPPSDIANGQLLAMEVYFALQQSPQWNKTLLVITYDEHGGLYDHVKPADAGIAADDDPEFRSYGVRVPALLVSPWCTSRNVLHEVFDHTSIIKTILLRYCKAANGSIPTMTARVAAANHLGVALDRTTPMVPSRSQNELRIQILDRARTTFAELYAERLSRIKEGKITPSVPNEFQEGLRAAQMELLGIQGD